MFMMWMACTQAPPAPAPTAEAPPVREGRSRTPPAAGTTPPAPPEGAPRTPAQLVGDWYLTDPYEGRRVIAKPCAARLSHLLLKDGPKGAKVAARRVQAVHLGNADAVTGTDGAWVYDMGDSPDWSFSFLDPSARLLVWRGADPSLAGPWVREADVDAYEYLVLPESMCNRPDPPPSLPADLPTAWWPLVWDGSAWHAAPGGGTEASLELVPDGGLTVVRRSGRGEERWPVVRVEASTDRVDFTLQTPTGAFLGMRLSRHRPPPPALEVGPSLDTPPSPAQTPPAAREPLPDGAWYLSLPGKAPYTAGVWAPSTTLTQLGR